MYRKFLNKTGSVRDIQQRSRSLVATRGQDRYIVRLNHFSNVRWKSVTETTRQTIVFILYSKNVILCKHLKLWFSVSQCYVEYNPFMIRNCIRVQGKIVDKCLHGTILFYTKQKHIKIRIWHYCISHAYYISHFILAQF